MTDVGVRHHPPDKEEIAEAFFRHLEEASQLHVLVLMGDFSYPDTCWRQYAAGKKQSRFVISLLLECIDNSFLTPVIKELTRGGILLDLMLTSKEELVRDVNEGCLACSKHEMVEFRILWGKNKLKCKMTNIDLRRTDHYTTKNPIGYIPGEERDPGELVSRITTSTSIATCRKSRNGSRGAACINKLLLRKCKHERKRTRGGSRDRWARRNTDTPFESASTGLGKPKPMWSWIWQGPWRTTGKGSTSTSRAKERLENVDLLLKWAEDSVTKDMEEVKVPNVFFTFMFTGQTCL